MGYDPPEPVPVKNLLECGPSYAECLLDGYISLSLEDKHEIMSNLFKPEQFLGEFPTRDQVIKFIFAFTERYEKHLIRDPETNEFIGPSGSYPDDKLLEDMGFLSFHRFLSGSKSPMFYRFFDEDNNNAYINLYYRQH
jgi:hypothetical protein